MLLAYLRILPSPPLSLSPSLSLSGPIHLSFCLSSLFSNHILSATLRVSLSLSLVPSASAFVLHILITPSQPIWICLSLVLPWPLLSIALSLFSQPIYIPVQWSSPIGIPSMSVLPSALYPFSSPLPGSMSIGLILLVYIQRWTSHSDFRPPTDWT